MTHVDPVLAGAVRVVQHVFGARAVSVLLYDQDAEVLRFAAVAGEGEGELEGRTIAASTGMAGWALAMREPLIVEDVAGDQRFAETVAASTGYVPSALMSVPLIQDDEALGVLQVLDRDPDARFGVEGLDLLAQVADLAVAVVARARPPEDFDRNRVISLLDEMRGLISPL